MSFEEIVEKLNEKDVKFETIQLPVFSMDNGWYRDTNNIVFKLNIDAAITLRNQTGYQVYKDDGTFKRKYQWQYSEVKAMIVNDEWDRLEVVFNHPLKKEKPFDKVQVSMTNNEVVGVYKNYNGVNHRFIVNSINAAYLNNRVRDYYLTDSEFGIYLRLEDEFDLFIYNGLNSDNAFGYNVYTNINGLKANIEFNAARKRHLSLVGEVFESLSEIFDELSEVNFASTLENTKARDVHAMLKHIMANKNDDKLQKLHDALDKWLDNELSHMFNARKYFEKIGSLTKEHGLKTVSKKYGQILLQKVFDVV